MAESLELSHLAKRRIEEIGLPIVEEAKTRYPLYISVREMTIRHQIGISKIQRFFEELKKGNIKVAYKPQQVDLIPKAEKGKTVRSLLKKVDDENKLKEIAKTLEIENILSNKIENISGGELQRVAIAATVLRDANLYIFDEPTSYLDIKQRIKISKFIKSLRCTHHSLKLPCPAFHSSQVIPCGSCGAQYSRIFCKTLCPSMRS